MNKVSQRLTLVLGIAAIPLAVWLLRGPLAAKPATDPPAAARSDPAEAAMREELNDLARHTSAPLDSEDAKRVSALSRARKNASPSTPEARVCSNC
jgi:hypothetical protein